MERFFDLQRFDDLGINMESGTKNSPKPITGFGGNDNLTNLMTEYVNISVDGGNDTVISSSSNHVTVDAGAGDDKVTFAAMQEAIILGDAGKDVIKVNGSTSITVDGGADDDEINIIDSSKVTVNAGEGADDISISEGSSDVTITAGDGADTIRLSTDAKNITVTDLAEGDTIVLSDFEALPRFATFVGGVLNLDGVKITMGTGKEYDKTSPIKVKVGNKETTLGKLLDKQPPIWEVGLNPAKTAYSGTMTYYSNASEHKALATVSGLDKKKLEAVANLEKDAKKKYVSQQFEDFPGITVDVNNNIILSSSLLPASGAITLASKDFKLALADDEVEFISEGTVSKKVMGFSVAGKANAVKTATFSTAAKSDGWYVGDDGKKLKFLKANAVSTTFSVDNLLATTATVTGDTTGAGSDGITYDISGNTGTVTVSKAGIFAEVAATKTVPAHKKAIIDGEDVVFEFTGGVSGLEVAGGKNDENIISSGTAITLSTAAGNDWVVDNGKQNKIDLGAGNDYFFGDYASDTVIAGAGDDFVQVLGDYNTINAGAGNDTLEFDGGTANTVNADAGNDVISVSSDATISKSAIIAGAGNDTVSVIGGVTEGVYSFNGNTIDLGAGDDHAYIENVSDTTIVAADGVNNISLKNINFGFVELGVTRAYNKDGSLKSTTYSKKNNTVNIDGASGTTVIATAGNDIFKVSKAKFTTFEGGAGADSATFSDSAVTNATIQLDAGKDNISIIGGTGEGNIFNTGADDDNIFVSGTGITKSTINASFGNDVISLVGGAGSGNVIYYNYGGGNDTIYGFSNDDKLVIAGENNMTVPTSISTVKIGKNANDTVLGLVVDVGKGATAGKITLLDWAGDSQTFVANITSGDAMEQQLVWTVSDGKATGKLNGKAVATITGLKKASSTETDNAKKKADIAAQNAAMAAALSDNGDTIIIGADALGTAETAKLSTKEGYTLAFGDDVTRSTDTSVGFTFKNGVANFGKMTTEIGYRLSDDKLSVRYVDKPEEHDGPIIEGLKADATDVDSDCFVVDGSTVYLSNAVLPVVTKTNDDDSTSDTGIKISGNYKLGLNTVEGAAKGGVVKVSNVKPAGWTFDVSSAETVTDVTKAAILMTADIPEGYYVNDKGGIGYNEESTATTLVTVHGLTFYTKDSNLAVSETADTDGKYAITVSGKALVNVPKNSTVEGSSIYLEDTDKMKDYKLVIGSGITKAALTAEGWKASGTTAYYQTRKIAKNGYAVSEDGQSIDYYTDDDGDNTVVTLTGLKSKMGTSANLTMASTTDDGSTTTTITVGKGALGGTDIELEVSENYDADSYKLELAGDVDSSALISGATWNTVKGGKSLQFVSAKYSEGYAVDEENDKHVIYTAAHGGKTDINVAGLTGATVAGVDTKDTGFVWFKNSSSDTVVLNVEKFANATNGASVTAYSDVESEGIYKAYGFELSVAGKLTNSGARGVSLIGSSGNDILVGNAGKDSLIGNAGNDNLNGGAGNDYLEGGKGNDVLNGGNGNDTLHSGEGEDVLKGGNGNDVLFAEGSKATLTGGTGNDVFVHAGTGETTITDYAAGADKILITDENGLTDATVTIEDSKATFTLKDNSKITVNNGKNKVITFIDSEGTKLVNPKKYITNGSAALWFEDETEFAGGEKLSDIMSSEVVGNGLENYDPEKVTQEKLIAYASK